MSQSGEAGRLNGFWHGHDRDGCAWRLHPQVRPISNSKCTIHAGKTGLSAGRLVGQQQLYSTPHAIEILFTPLPSRVTMAHRMRPARKSMFLRGPNVTIPCLAPTPGGIACAAAARRGRLSGGFNGGSMNPTCPLSSRDY